MESHKTDLKGFVEVPNFAQIIEEEIDPSLIVLDKRIKGCHISLLGIRRLIRKVLKHFCNLDRRVIISRTTGRKVGGERRILTSVRVRRGCLAGTPSTSMYA